MIRRVFTPLLLIAVLLSSMTVSVAVPVSLPISLTAVASPPAVTAEAWIVYDATFDVVLAEHNADERRPMASTTKIMTGILAVENGNMDDLVTVSANATSVGEAEIDLETGEKLTLRQLTGAFMVRSANDAAIAVGEHLGNGSLPAFIDMMNQRASDLDLSNTQFQNPHGLDATGHYTSARDLLTMALHGMQYRQFAEFVSAKTVTISNAPDGTPRTADSTNKMLLSYSGAIGVKTGYTDNAKLVLASAATRQGRTIYAIVMGSDQHFADATALLDYGFDNFRLLSAVTAAIAFPPVRAPVVVGAADPPTAVPPVTDERGIVSLKPTILQGSPFLLTLVDGVESERVGPQKMSTPLLPSPADAFRWLLDLFT